MAVKKKSVESLKHKDRRANIPTEELRDFVAEDEQAPQTMRYPRDPALDPQLVWKGKDEQDAADLAVPVVPIYIQEKIHPQAIVDDLLARYPKAEGGRVGEAAAAYQLNFFADFNGGPADFAQKVEFYQHEQHWTNRMILGDSLLVMTSLAGKERLKGKVQTIYIDPPYGIKFGSNWQVSTRKRDVKDGKAEDATRQPEQIRAFRDTWQLGIHSYLAYLRDRLVASRELLTETGSIFVQIGDENVHLVRCLMDEVFGSENCAGVITFRKTSGLTADRLAQNADFLLWYGKNIEQLKYRQIYLNKGTDSDLGFYSYIEMADGARRRIAGDESLVNLPKGARPYSVGDLTSSHHYSEGIAPFEFEGMNFSPGNRYWTTSPEGMKRLAIAHRIHKSLNSLRYVRFIDDFPVQPLTSNWTDTITGQYSDPRLYVVQTASLVISRCLLMTTDPGDLVLDPTCGSGTTAYVAEQWGRRWITIDTSRVALALARTRLMSARYPYFLLADSPEGLMKEAELSGKLPPDYPTGHDIRKGFVYRKVPHITLKSIANNPDIREGMSRGEIDAAIARHADTEILYDQPYEDGNRVRVCGPFSVESLSPHRVLSPADDNLDGTVSEREAKKQQDFSTMILENLIKAGVQNTRKRERIKFDTLAPYASPWIQAAGEYTDADGKTRRVAVSIGPEHGTVGPVQIKEAAKEAVQGIGFDLLIVCGFAFDPHVSEEIKRYGKLTVLPAKMNPDLAMGDELLKKTGAGNLFMVFGEPDVELIGEEWIVDSNKERIAPYGIFKLVSGTDSLAEIDRLERNDLRDYAELSCRGEVWDYLADAASRHFDTGQHRRGTSAPEHGGVSTVAWHCAGVAGGIGNVFDTLRKAGVLDTGEWRKLVKRLRGNQQNASRADALARSPQITKHHSLSTIHYSLSTILQVELKGVDVYDPTTGQIRNASTDDIACWFIDSDYNGESFFVRHAYFTGAEEPYDKLKRALRAEVDEAAWSTLYTTVSHPCDPPATGKIAVKVINHYGDEVLKVFDVR